MLTSAENTASPAKSSSNFSRRRLDSLALVSLLVTALVASVVLPALETRRIRALLREVKDVIEPARALSWRLESGLAMEYSALQGYALSGDNSFLRRYQMLADDEMNRLAALERLARPLGPRALERTADIRRRVTEWQESNRVLFPGQLSAGQYASAARAEQAGRDSVTGAIDRVAAYLSSEAEIRAEEVRGHENRSLLVNAGLVFVALAAIVAVVALMIRERRLAAILERRVDEESALRIAAEALAGAFTVDEVAQQIAHSALYATQAVGVYAKLLKLAPDGTLEVEVRGQAGTGVPELRASRPYSGSYTEQAINLGGPVLVSDLVADPSRADAEPSNSPESTIVLPIGQPEAPTGALFIIDPARGRFPSDSVWAHTFSHLAALAYEKVRLLDEARDGRLAMERLMGSRQRLMRGFSHDVKNPLGAADGYADLLSSGIYGQLTPEQNEKIQRIRRSIRSALDLIDDLHELARAETGNVALRRYAVDTGDLVRAIGDEYRGAANSSGLSLTVDVTDDPPTIETDGARVRQIVGNLLSNAIKYTKAGSVVLRVRECLGLVAGATGWVHFDVTDTGLGIPADKRDVIFEEFSRLGVHDRAGAGLGLAISKRLAEALGGQITLVSEVGSGSTFTLRLPLRYQEASGLIADNSQRFDERRSSDKTCAQPVPCQK